MNISRSFLEWLLTATLLTLFSCVFLYTLRSNSRSSHKLPPCPPKLPIIGNLHQILGKSLSKALWQLSRQYGPVMQIYIGSKQFLVISSADMAKQILKTQDHIFCSRELFPATKQRLSYNFVDVAFSPHNSHWREMRKILMTEFLGAKRAKLYNSVLVTEIENTLSSLSVHPLGTEVNVSNMLFEVVKQLVCKVSFGKNYRQQPLKGPSWEVMLSETMELLNGSIGDSFPSLGFLIYQFSGWNRRLNDGFRNLDAYIDTIIDDHLKQHNTGEEISEEDKDFVHTVLDMCSDENVSGYRLNYTELKALVMDILAGGVESTVATMTWVMAEIARNTRVMQKLQNEIRNCSGRIRNVEELDTTKMTYLKWVVKEALRLHPVAPLLIPHVSLSHTQIDGYDVFPNTPVLVNTWGIQRDTSVWGDNADDFYPERFEKLDGDFGRERFEMMPFGGGRRSCPATKIAPANVEHVIASLLYWFDWELPSGMKSEDLNMEDGGTLVVGKKVPLFLVPTKHKWEN